MRRNRGTNILTPTRRQLVAAAVAASSRPFQARSEPVSDRPHDTLALGLDIADVTTFDPARLPSYTSPLVLAACYDTLVTMQPGEYRGVTPRLAQRWEKLPQGAGWRFTLDPAATFHSGNRVTPEDCRFSLDRARQAGDGVGQFVTNILDVTVSGPDTLDVRLRRPDEDILAELAAPCFGILEKALVQARSRAGDATEWLNTHSAGSGPYVLAGWARRQSVQLAASPHPWHGAAGFRRVTVAHMPTSSAQLRAIQRGEIDAAFNLIPEQIDSLQTEPAIRVETVRSLDFVYLALTADQSRNPALAQRDARAAVAAAIDYDDLLGRLLGGSAVRPAHFLPIGVTGSTEAVAARVGPHQDLDRARTLLRSAGAPDGFEFELAYGDDAVAGVTYHALARKLQTDLRRVGIRVQLRQVAPATLRAEFVAGTLQAALAFWHAPVVDPRVWAEASIDRVGRRLGWVAPNPLPPLIADAASANPETADALWMNVQSALVEAATTIVLFQPTYQVAVRDTVKSLPLTAAGWMAELRDAAPV